MTQPPTTTAPARPAPLPPTSPTPAAPPTPRSLAPDLARGALLLLIALANVWGYLWSDAGSNVAGGRPVGGSSLDRLVDGLTTLLVDSHTKPMFAILYGFGLATMVARLTARGADRTTMRGVIGRRSVALIVLGLVHATLLYGGDILAPYGAAGLLALLFLHRSRVALAWWFGVAYVVSMSAGAVALLAASESGGATEPTTTTYLSSAVERLTATATVASLYTLTLMFVPHLVVGILLARAGWLTRPAEHRRRLGQVAAVAAAVSLVGSAPYALAVAQVWHPDHTGLVVAELVHHVSGDVMGLGYVCLFGWLAAVWGGRTRHGLVAAVTAVGERSLTCYLLQSVLFAPLLSDWGLGLGGHLSTTQAAVLAVVVWLATVAVAVTLQRAGRRGPFEVALRRIAYGQGHDHR